MHINRQSLAITVSLGIDILDGERFHSTDSQLYADITRIVPEESI